jgi:biotin-[acetyl-CoA-carboxylase] ligase BirA-like protein
MDLIGQKILFKIEKICSLNLIIPKTVYVPREDTYLLADAIIKIGIKVGNAMEIGCGSGALSLLMAHLGWRVRSCDINPNAVMATKTNAKNNQLDSRVIVEQNGIGDKLIFGSKINLIVWNLPYLNPLKDDEDRLEFIEDAAYIDIDNGGWSEKLIGELKKSNISDECVILLLFRVRPISPSTPLSWKLQGWASRRINYLIIGDEKLEVHAFWKPGFNQQPIILDECESTMEEAKLLSTKGWDRVVANKQINGRGRRNSSWNSKSGDLTATWLISKSMLKDIQIGLLQIEIGSIVANALAANLKWPNDIFSDDFKKIGGIILESSDTENHIRLGIGINKYPREIGGIVTSGWVEKFDNYTNMDIFTLIDAALSSRFEVNYIKSDIEYSDYLENSWASLSRFLSRGVSASIYNNKFQERVVKLSENGSLDFANYNKIINSNEIDDINWRYFV